MADPIGAYQIITDSQPFVDNKKISNAQLRTFNYLRNFTFMSMGDLEAAQRSYYEDLELAELKKRYWQSYTLDGKIAVLRSQENNGTTFLISFPALTEVEKAPVDMMAYH